MRSCGSLLDHIGSGSTHLAQFVLVDELLAGRSHNRQTGGGQRQNQVGAGRVVVVGGVGAAVGVAEDQQDARSADIDDGIEHGATGLDDAAGLLLATRQEAGGVFHEDDRNVVDVAEADEAGDLDRRVAVDLAGGDGAVVGDEADHIAAQTAEGGDHLAGALRLQLEVVAMVADLLDDDRDVERGVEAGRRVEGLLQQGVDLPGLAVERIAGLLEGGDDAVVVREVGEQPHRRAQRGNLVGHGQVGNAGLAVDLGPAQLFGGDVLAQHRLDHARAGQTEEGVVRLDHEASLAGQIAAAAGVEAEHAHDGGDHAADLAQRGEGLGITVKTADAGRDEGAGASRSCR